MAFMRRLQVVRPRCTETDTMPGISIAFATSDLEHVDQHFGSTRSLAIYRLEQGRAQLLEAIRFGNDAQDGGEGKLKPRIECLKGCVAVFSEAVGSSAIRQLLAQGIQPVKVPQGSRIAVLVRDIQNDLGAGITPPWLARNLFNKGETTDRLQIMANEPWEEEG